MWRGSEMFVIYIEYKTFFACVFMCATFSLSIGSFSLSCECQERKKTNRFSIQHHSCFCTHVCAQVCNYTKKEQRAERKTEPTAFTQSSYRAFWLVDRSVSQPCLCTKLNSAHKLQKLSCTQNKWQCVRDIRNRYKHMHQNGPKKSAYGECVHLRSSLWSLSSS